MPPPPANRIGRHLISSVGGEAVKAYLPPPLPPKPSLALEPLQLLLEQANQALGRLDGFAAFLPDPSLFIYAYVRKEALLSSQIEGTQSSLSDLMLFENGEAPGALHRGPHARSEANPRWLPAFASPDSRNP
jgi:hypothetical protein